MYATSSPLPLTPLAFVIFAGQRGCLTFGWKRKGDLSVTG
jgi:hypothetical protein